MAALVSLKSQNDHSSFLIATRTLVTFIANITAHPDDPKYRRVKADNFRFRAQLGDRPGGLACMCALGFSSIVEAGEVVRDQSPNQQTLANSH